MLRVIIATIIVFALSCDKSNQYKQFGKRFIEAIDKSNYNEAYNLLSNQDKKILNIDRFKIEMEQMNRIILPIKDSIIEYASTQLNDTVINDFLLHKLNIKEYSETIYKVMQLRIIPDYSTILSTCKDCNMESQKQAIMDRISTGKYPCILDSSRSVFVFKDNNSFHIAIGAKYWLAKDTLDSLFNHFIKKKIKIVNIDKKGHIYRSISGEVVGKIKFSVQNDSRDSISMSEISGQIDGINFEPTYSSNLDDIPPKSISKDSVFISNQYFSSLLGYSKDEIFSPCSLFIASYPHYSKGPDHDSIMNICPNVEINCFIQLSKQVSCYPFSFL